MGTVVKRHTRRKTGQRRSHHAIKPTTLGKTASSVPSLPHQAHPVTGEYRGRVVKAVQKKAARNARRRNATSA